MASYLSVKIFLQLSIVNIFCRRLDVDMFIDNINLNEYWASVKHSNIE